MVQTFLRRHDVEHLVGLRRSSIYAKIKVGEFPQPVRISDGAVAWLESEIADWQAARIAERKKASPR